MQMLFAIRKITQLRMMHTKVTMNRNVEAVQSELADNTAKSVYQTIGGTQALDVKVVCLYLVILRQENVIDTFSLSPFCRLTKCYLVCF